MKYEKVIEYPKSHLESYELMFGYGEDELIENDIPRLENIKTWTAKFDNGFEMDIKINSSENDVWSEAVLFDEKFNQLVCTDVCDSLSGEWSIEFNGDEYVVNLKGT